MQLEFPTAFQTVDIAIVDSLANPKKLLLCRKQKDPKGRWRFPGGFSDPESINLETDAIREVLEEVQVSVYKPFYIGSSKVPDYRYDGTDHCIKTAMFVTEQTDILTPTVGDDLIGGDVMYFDINDITPDLMVEHHQHLLEMFEKTLPKTLLEKIKHFLLYKLLKIYKPS